jgi:hypothetical protein
MQQSPSVMQNLVDSLCQCFSASSSQPPPSRSSHDVTNQQQPEEQRQSNSAGLATPEHKRRTRSLGLNENQWDALFDGGVCTAALQPRRNRSTNTSPVQNERGMSMEQAQAVAKAKWAAVAKTPPKSSSSSSPRSSNGNGNSKHQRKRPRSRDDIFRSKREPPPNTNALSRFLTNHPAIMNSLCFATPIHGDDSFNQMDCAASVVSDSNTLNTAEDTITSTLYYETTKLAGLKQKNPPMPLFNSHAVEAKDDIHTIVATRSHSSFRLSSSSNNDALYQLHPDDEVLLEEDEPTPPSSPQHARYEYDNGTTTNGTGSATTPRSTRCSEEVPPPVTKLSSDSSKS